MARYIVTRSVCKREKNHAISVFQAKKGRSRVSQPLTEGPLIDLRSDPEQGRAVTEDTQPETDAERLAKLKVRHH